MVENSQLFADQISLVGRTTGGKVDVVLTNELVGLLSEQMYRSPLKAVEELVVNAYDADASECRVFVPAQDDDRKFVVVFDDGAGMNEDGLQDLWAIGRSKKRDDDYQTRLNRKQIGKFGIGKLATYTIAKRVTYISKSENEILGVTIDYTQFQSASPGKSNELELPVHRLDADELANVGIIKSAISALGIDAILATLTSTKSWTLVLMEDFKEKAKRLQIGRLRRVLSTAMPLKSDFKLYVNGGQVESSKAEADFVSEWDVTDLPSNRLDTVNQTTEDNWRVIDGTIISDSFPQGVSGRVLVTVPTLTGKSDDLARSNGFFIRVRGRLVSEGDERVRQAPFVNAPYINRNNEPKYHAMLLRAHEADKHAQKYVLWMGAQDTPSNPAEISKNPEKLKQKLESLNSSTTKKLVAFQVSVLCMWVCPAASQKRSSTRRTRILLF